MMEDRTNYVRVTNKNPEIIRGRYAGKDYVFKPNAPVDVHEVVAHHIFGFGAEDQIAAMNRLGWMKSSNDWDEAKAKLKKVVFSDPPEMIEAPPGKKQRLPKRAAALLESPSDPDDEDEETPDEDDDDETGSAGPPVSAGGSEGGALKAPPNGPRIGQATGEADDLI
jgi:hypothetical protein